MAPSARVRLIDVNHALDRRGLLFGASAYFIWGLFPIFMAALMPAGAFEIVAHRALWSLVVCVIIVTVVRKWRRVRTVMSDRVTMLRLTAAAALIGINWGVMVYAVVTERVASTSLGYYINPLLTVALSVVFLGERLRRLQMVAISIATVAVVILGLELGGLPWIALTLASTFALYALIKKGVGSKVDALTGLTVETAVMVPAVAIILWLVARSGAQTFLVRGEEGLGLTHDLLLAFTGVWTAGALIVFAAGARRLPLNIMGLLQYIAPTMTFLLAVWYFNEPMSPARWSGFALVWLALVLITVDSWRSRTRRKGEAAAAGEVTEPV
ncbi:MAG: EamA family transporter RarD [Actinobacteria bacterium HGW-Actinobacteria-4]|nr:MAG: EamA family transporter RarD [Actinobacteria bacterium HGW-Actinobacteria-4]